MLPPDVTRRDFFLVVLVQILYPKEEKLIVNSGFTKFLVLSDQLFYGKITGERRTMNFAHLLKAPKMPIEFHVGRSLEAIPSS